MRVHEFSDCLVATESPQPGGGVDIGYVGISQHPTLLAPQDHLSGGGVEGLVDFQVVGHPIGGGEGSGQGAIGLSLGSCEREMRWLVRRTKEMWT